MDDAPQWDGALAEVDPAPVSLLARVDVDKVDDPGQRPSDDQYLRYVSLVSQIAACGFGPGPFAVYDPFITAMLVRAESDLAVVASALGDSDRAERADRRAARMHAGLMERLWEPKVGRFGYHDVTADRRATPDVIGAYGPLLLGEALPDRVAEALREGLELRYATPWPLPTTAPSEPTFDARRYWRGPSWINVNWLLAPFVGIDIVDRSLELLDREGFREYFDPLTGEGLGARSFSWSAALALDWLAAR